MEETKCLKPSDSWSRIDDRVGVGATRTFPPEGLFRVHHPKVQSAAEFGHPPERGVERWGSSGGLGA
jgi:hypothetical protein